MTGGVALIQRTVTNGGTLTIICSRQMPPPRSTLFPYTTLFRSDVQNDNGFFYYPCCPTAGSVINNAGLVRKSTRLNSSNRSNTNTVNHSNTINVRTGTVVVSVLGTSKGTYNIAAGTTLALSGGT